MKTRLIPFAIAAVTIAITSCDKKETAGADIKAKTDEAQPAMTKQEELATQLMDASQKVFEAALEAKDRPSANMAANKIRDIGKEIDAIYAEFEKLPPASPEAKVAIQAKLKERDKVMLSKRIEVNQLMQSLPADATELIAGALLDCSKVMESHKDEFQRHFGVW